MEGRGTKSEIGGLAAKERIDHSAAAATRARIRQKNGGKKIGASGRAEEAPQRREEC
jgi:hypothetical protein